MLYSHITEMHNLSQSHQIHHKIMIFISESSNSSQSHPFTATISKCVCHRKYHMQCFMGLDVANKAKLLQKKYYQTVDTKSSDGICCWS
jgi:hypothetical protein